VTDSDNGNRENGYVSLKIASRESEFQLTDRMGAIGRKLVQTYRLKEATIIRWLKFEIIFYNGTSE